MIEKNQIFKNIMNRTSVRSYTDMPVEPEKVEMMLLEELLEYCFSLLYFLQHLQALFQSWKR